MTDLSNLPPEVREAIEEVRSVFERSGHWSDRNPYETLRDYILRVTAERDALAKRIADAPVATVVEHKYQDDRCITFDVGLLPKPGTYALVKVG